MRAPAPTTNPKLALFRYTLVDAIVAWGDIEVIRERIVQHQEAGADHVCLQAIGPDMSYVPNAEWKTLVAALL